MPKHNSGNGNRSFGLGGVGKGSAERSSKWREHYDEIDWQPSSSERPFDPVGHKLIKRYGAPAPTKLGGYPMPPNRLVEAVPYESPHYKPKKFRRLRDGEQIEDGDYMTAASNVQEPEPRGLILAKAWSGRRAGDHALLGLLFYRKV